LGEKIGEGAHGVVRHCSERSTGRGFAVKTITLDREHILFLKKNFTDIKALRHEHVIGYHALFFEMSSETCHLVMEYLPFLDLLHLPAPDEQVLLAPRSSSRNSSTSCWRRSASSTSTRSATATSNPKISSLIGMRPVSR
jgi:serine/threonine protein kinase